MKNTLKISAGLVAAAAITATAVAPVAVQAWSDGMPGGRPSFTLEEVRAGKLGDKIVLNSISNSVIGDEKNFVGARAADAKKDIVFAPGENGLRHSWNGNELKIEENKDYVVRLYVHNNNPNGEKAVAKDVKVAFNVSNKAAKEMKVGGYISTSNATPKWYYDDVTLKSDKPFKLAFVSGSALLENNKGAFKLSDDIVKKNGVKVGLNQDGDLPGCFEFAQYVSIKVRPVFEQTKVNVHKRVRPVGTKEWKDYAVAKVGDKMEYSIEFTNLEGNVLDNVMVKDVLPKNVKIVPGTVTLYNGNHPKGTKLSDQLFDKGLNIGSYKTKSNAILTFQVEVVDNELVCGLNRVRNWGQVDVGPKTIQDFADLMVRKDCQKQPEKPVDPVNPQSEIPATGPASIVMGAIGAGSLITAIGYFIASRKKLQ